LVFGLGELSGEEFSLGGEARYDRRRDWFALNRERFLEALG